MSNTRTFGTPGSTARSPDPAASQASKTDSGGSNLFGASNPNSIDIKQHLEDLEQKLNYVYDNYVGGSSLGGSSVTNIISGNGNNFPEGSPTSNILNNPGNYIVYNGLLESGNVDNPNKKAWDYPLLAKLNSIDWRKVNLTPVMTDSIYTWTKFERGWVEEDGQIVRGIVRQGVLSLHDAETEARTRYTDPDLRREYIANMEKYYGSIKHTYLHANAFYGAAVAVKLNDYWRARTDWAETNYDWPGNTDMPPSRWGESLGIYEVASYNYVGLLAPSSLAPWPPDELQPHEPYLIPTLQAGQVVSHEYYINKFHPWADMQYAYDSEGNNECWKYLSWNPAKSGVRLTVNEIDFLDRWPRHSAFYDATKQAFIKMQYDPITWAEHMEVNGTVTINGGYWREQGTTPGRYPGLHVYGDIVIHDGQIRYESS